MGNISYSGNRAIQEETGHSGTVTAGGASQQLMAANASRMGWSFQNQSTENLFVRVNAAATADQNSLLIAPGAYYEAPNRTVLQINVIGATTGDAFYAREW